MEEVEQSLTKTIVENAAQETIFGVGVAQSVAMSKIKDLVVDFRGDGSAMKYDATLFFQIPIGPDVMVSDEVVNLNTHVSQFGYLSQKACESLRDNIPVLVPKVEHIAHEIDGGSLVLNAVEETYEPSFLCSLVLNGK